MDKWYYKQKTFVNLQDLIFVKTEEDGSDVNVKFYFKTNSQLDREVTITSSQLEAFLTDFASKVDSARWRRTSNCVINYDEVDFILFPQEKINNEYPPIRVFFKNNQLEGCIDISDYTEEDFDDLLSDAQTFLGNMEL